MSDPVPAIAEASATGAVAELFADIRRVLGVEVVNLIWRPPRDDPECTALGLGDVAPALRRRLDCGRGASFGQLALPRLPPFPPDLLSLATPVGSA